jgi:hypothetical protein
MSHIRTVVEVMETVFAEDGTLQYEDGKLIEKPTGDMFYLLHWGLQVGYADDYLKQSPFTYTVGICQEMKTGRILTFLPYQLRIVGIEQNK